VAEEVLGGYRLLKHMVTGQTSQVWEVVEVASGRHFAMKLLLPEKAREPMHRSFLFHEASVGKQLAHPNIIKIYNVEKSHSNPYFVMEFFPAGNLKLRLLRRETAFLREKLPDIFRQWVTGLSFMNAKGWVHRDVKPDNVLVNSAGELRVIDFALSQRVEKEGFFSRLFRRKAKAQGTRSYMSPEQIRGLPLDARADIYSFGASAYEMVTGRPPFRGTSAQDLLAKHIIEKPVTPRNFNPDVTEEFATLVLKMLAKKKQDRPKTFHEVLSALGAMRVFKDAPPPSPS
jgi:serine/threonine protein kinase